MRTVYWYSGRIQYVTPKHSPRRITPFSIISIEMLCANAVIDTFVTSKGFNFLFNHITVWMAFSIESSNTRASPPAKGWGATTCFHESVPNNFPRLTFVLTKRGPSKRLISNSPGERLPFFLSSFLIAVRNQCTQTSQAVYRRALIKLFI